MFVLAVALRTGSTIKETIGHTWHVPGKGKGFLGGGGAGCHGSGGSVTAGGCLM